jgi:drug/metabolite transporter (DMT)-like permease
MSAKRVIGIALIVVGIVALVWGGVFWTNRETILDAGPLEVQTEERDGFALPPVAGILAIVGGAILLFVPDRRRA